MMSYEWHFLLYLQIKYIGNCAEYVMMYKRLSERYT